MANPRLAISHYNKGLLPCLDRFSLKQYMDTVSQRLPARHAKTDEQKTVVRAWCEAADVGKSRS